MDLKQTSVSEFCLDVVLMWQAWPLCNQECLQQRSILFYNALTEKKFSQCVSVSSCIWWWWLAYHHLATTLLPVYHCLGVKPFAFYFDVLMEALCWDIALLSTVNKWIVRSHPVAPCCCSPSLDHQIMFLQIQRSNSWTKWVTSPLNDVIYSWLIWSRLPHFMGSYLWFFLIWAPDNVWRIRCGHLLELVFLACRTQQEVVQVRCFYHRLEILGRGVTWVKLRGDRTTVW